MKYVYTDSKLDIIIVILLMLLLIFVAGCVRLQDKPKLAKYTDLYGFSDATYINQRQVVAEG